ncbi:hypothetical protein [Larkinella rosea]|uniref:hypothetical protein n=1 Tax=Larkinella rosea TaxID=2025312 RepID=UPI001E432CA4|nr:hypothetical protein [Larkinella rosea]
MTSSTTNENPNPEQDEKLRELTAQSWNLELVISGAALFAVLQLPDLLDEAFDYFRFNLMTQTTGLHLIFPSLVYSLMRATGYVLFMAFLTNFVMRAYWVGLVGLRAVYPSGIHYDRIPFTTKQSQERMAAKLGPLDAYVHRLDQRCNIVFAVAFLFVFLLILVAFTYVQVLVIYSIVRPVVPAPYWLLIKIVAGTLALGYLFTSVVLNLPRIRSNPRGAIWHDRFTAMNKVMYWGLYKPVVFIVNTFYSHIPYQKLARTMVLMMGCFFVVVMVEFLVDFSRVNRRTTSLNRHHLFSTRVDSLYVNPSAYNNLRAEDAYIEQAAIQADVTRDPFIRLFIAYPKALDTLLTRLAPEPVWSDTLARAEKRRRFAAWSHQQINQFIHLTINDSLYQNPDLLFTQWGQHHQKGWQTVLLPTNLRPGKNLIRIGIQADPSKRPEEIITLPFWYIPEK